MTSAPAAVKPASINGRSALWFAARGWAVLPLHAAIAARCTCANPNCTSPAKHPRTSNGVHGATCHDRAVADAWRRWPDANVGIATGAASKLFVLDIDPRHGGEDALDTMLLKHGKLPETVEVLTGGGGRHLYFRHPGDGAVPCSVGKVGPGLDVRGDGGFVVAPPSLHASGKRYEFEASSRPDNAPVSHAPAWLLGLVRGGGADGAPTPPSEWRELAGGTVAEGGRNDAVARLAGYLLRKGRYVDPHVLLELVLCWNAKHCKPPLTDSEVVKTVDSIAARELRRRG